MQANWRKEEQKSPFFLDRWGTDKHEHAMAYDLEEWYSECEQFTFPTQFIPLSMEEANTILEIFKIKSRKSTEENQLPKELQEKLNNLENKVNNLINEIKQKSEKYSDAGFFIRLSSRSPKDAGFSDDYKHKMIESLSKQLQDNPIDSYYNLNEIDKNNFDFSMISDNISILNVPWKQKYIVDDKKFNLMLNSNYHSNLFYFCLSDVLRVKNGKDVLDLLTNSERTYHDLIYELKYPETWRMQIILRLWDSRVSIDHEFRCFVCCGKISGISQYNPYSMYPYLLNQDEQVRKLIFCIKKIRNNNILNFIYRRK